MTAQENQHLECLRPCPPPEALCPGNLACISVFSSKSVDLKPSFSNILKCLSIYDICLLVRRNILNIILNILNNIPNILNILNIINVLNIVCFFSPNILVDKLMMHFFLVFPVVFPTDGVGHKSYTDRSFG